MQTQPSPSHLLPSVSASKSWTRRRACWRRARSFSFTGRARAEDRNRQQATDQSKNQKCSAKSPVLSTFWHCGSSCYCAGKACVCLNLLPARTQQHTYNLHCGESMCLYRPRVGFEEVSSLADIQRFYMILSPGGNAKKSPNRLMVVGMRDNFCLHARQFQPTSS